MREPIVAPDGRTWVVRRRWVPRLGSETLWRRFRRRFRRVFSRVEDVSQLDTGCAPDIAEGLVVLAVILLAVFVGIPFLVALLDVVLLLLLGALGLLARVLFRRPWIIDAHASDGTVRTWRVTGWQASQQRRDEIEAQLRAGLDPPPDPPAH